jgi:hypothetical protein
MLHRAVDDADVDTAPSSMLSRGGCVIMEDVSPWTKPLSMLRDGAYSLAADQHHLPRR